MLKIIKGGARFISFNYASLLLTTLRGIFLIDILTPASLGIYRLIFTYSSYFRYYNLGLNALAFYRAPARSLQEIYSSLLAKVNLFLSISFGLIFASIFGFASWSILLPAAFVDFVFWLFLILVITQVSETLITIAKIRAEFEKINQYNMIFSLTSIVLMVGLGFLLELRGVIVGLAVSSFVSLLFLAINLKSRQIRKVRLSQRRVFIFFRHGIKVILPGMLIVCYSTCEIWLISYKYGIVETGYYSVVMTFMNIILLLNSDALVFVYAKRPKDVKNRKPYIFRLTCFSFLLIFFICAAGIPVVELGINYFFPDYARAEFIYQLCFWGIPFLVCKNFVVYYISHNKTAQISLLLLGVLSIKIVCLLTFVKDPVDFYRSIAWFNALLGIALLTYFLTVNVQEPRPIRSEQP